MSWLDGLRHRIRVLLLGARYTREQAEEAALHQELETEGGEPVPLGTSRPADSSARLAWLDRLSQDLRYGLRGLARSPGFTATVVVTLAIGVGANAAVFSFLDRVFVRPPGGVEDPGGIRRIYHQFERTGSGLMTMASQNYPSYATIRDAVAGSADVVAYTSPSNRTLGADDESISVGASWVTGNYFATLGVRPALGRLFAPSDTNMADANPVAVISHTLWQSAFAMDSSAVGRSVELGGTRFTIIGVAGRNFAGIDITTAQVFLPMATFPVQPQRGVPWYQDSGNYLQTFTRVRSDAGDAAVFARAAIAYNAQPQIPGYRRDSNTTLVAGPISAARGPSAAGQEVSISTRLGGVSLLVLLIACANVANLLLVRATTRRREIAVRLAMGVSHGRLVSQLLTESLLLASIGGAAALAIAWWGGRALRSALLPNVQWAGGSLDLRVIAFTGFVSIAAGVAAGLAPAVHTRKTSLVDALKGGAREGGHHRSRLRNGLLVAQTALAVVLVAGAGLFVNSLGNVRAIRLGYAVDSLVYVNTAGAQPVEVDQAITALAGALTRVEGVRGTAYSSSTPMGGWTGFRIGLPGRDSIPLLDGPDRYPMMNWVSSSFFPTVGMRIVAGRAFDDSERGVVVVNETMAKTFWPGEDPLGKCILMGGPAAQADPCTYVVGVSENASRYRVIEEPNMQYFLPNRGQARVLIVRVEPDRAVAVAVHAQAELKNLLPGVRTVTATRMRDRVDQQLRPWRLGAALFTVFGALALAVAAVGVYSVIAYSVSQRTHEMGVRIALGARAADVLRLVVREGARVLLIGIALGVGTALAAGKLIASLLYGVTPRDPVVMVFAALVLIAVGVVASLVPAWRAARADPLVALRAD